MSPSFADLGVSPELVPILRARKIDEPFPVQALTVPDALAGRDLCGRAPTGSGKTLAFGIPLAARVGRAEARRPRGLVLVPTRELAAQVQAELEWIGAPRRLRVTACYGGVGLAPQRAALRRGVDILVACPGRLIDLVERGDAELGAVEVVVVDEADRMADMGFLPQVRRLLDLTPRHRQTLLFSATLDGAVDALVRRYQHDPVVHRLAEEESRARHHFRQVEQPGRVSACAEIVRASGPTIVFCRTRRRADRVARQLDRAGVRTAALHGDRSQSQRDRALAAFADRRIDALVATDVAARGIHVDDVACVVHFDLPADTKDYTHRSGRTARAGAFGTVISLVGSDEAAQVRRLQRELGVAPGPAADSPALPRGTVRWFNRKKGYGFIARAVGDDLFVHGSAIERGNLAELVGRRVEFEVGQGAKGEHAHKVRVLAGA